MRLLLLAAAASLMLAQEFEVATIKASPLYNQQTTRFGVSGGPGTNDPGIMSWSTTSLATVIATAYEIPVDRIVNPAAIPRTPFDITAKVPAGTAKPQIPAMLRKLLEQRFRLAVHSEMRDSRVYLMTVAKGGSKLKPADENAKPPDGLRTMGAQQVGNDMFPFPQAGEGASLGMNGNERFVARSVTIAKLADLLSPGAGRPIIDKTGLTGTYDVKLAFTPQPNRDSVAPPPPLSGPATGSAAPAQRKELDGTQTLSSALAQFGLALTPGKAPVKFIVIDHIESAPTAN